MIRLLARLTPALALAAAGVLVPFSAPAQAAACSGTQGVTVIVDFGDLGGGVQAGCDPSVDGRAAASFADAGFNLAYATADPGFVCRVNGRPADAACVEASAANAYWSLWWSDGQGGPWVYSTLGVPTLRPPEGGYVAFAWHRGGGHAGPPAVNPTVRRDDEPAAPPQGGSGQSGSGQNGHGGSTSSGGATSGTRPGATRPGAQPTKRPATRPSSRPTTIPSGTPAAVPSTPGAASSTTASASSSPSASASSSPTGTPTASPSPSDPTASASSTSATALPDATDLTGPEDVAPAAAETKGSDGASVWVVVGVVVLVLGAGGAAAVRRRTTG